MLRAFFVGNSFTVFREAEGGRGSALHDLPGLLAGMAPGRLKTGFLARAGASLEDHRREGRLAAGLAAGWLLGSHQAKGLPSQGMKWMGYTNLLTIICAGCIE